MTASLVTITGLTASGAANQINLQWSISDPHVGGLPFLQFDHAEVRYASDAGMTSPTTLSTSASFSYNHLQVLGGASYYYQVRAVDKSGQFGPWCDAVQGTEAAIDSSAIATAWTNFTPTIASITGALGAYTLGSCRYKQAGLLCLGTVEFTVTSVGTGATGLRVSGIPFEAQNSDAAASAYYTDGSTNVSCSAAIFDNGTNASIIDVMKYDGTSPIAANRTFVVTWQFEIDV